MTTPSAPHFTRPTTDFWQEVLPPDPAAPGAGPWQFGYPAQLPDGRQLVLPIRPLASAPSHAVASLLVNHASLVVAQTLGEMLADALRPLEPEVIVGLPTLGLSLAAVAAAKLGHSRYIPLGYSRKFWYQEELSTVVHSITSPAAGKRVYLDPNLQPLLAGKRLALVDDALSTGTTMVAVWDLMEALGFNVVACGVAMRQGRRWQDKLGLERTAKVVGVFDSPLLKAVPDGWALRD